MFEPVSIVLLLTVLEPVVCVLCLRWLTRYFRQLICNGTKNRNTMTPQAHTPGTYTPRAPVRITLLVPELQNIDDRVLNMILLVLPRCADYTVLPYLARGARYRYGQG